MENQSLESLLALIGRVLINFQRLELCIKAAGKLGTIEGPLPKIHQAHSRRVNALNQSTLGPAIQAWLLVMKGEAAIQSPQDDLFEATLGVSFSLNVEEAEKVQHAQALERLLEERNHFVHGGLANVNWTAPDEIQSLTDSLNELNRRIASQIEFLAPILTEAEEARRAFREFIGSGEFAQFIGSDKDEETPNITIEAEGSTPFSRTGWLRVT